MPVNDGMIAFFGAAAAGAVFLAWARQTNSYLFAVATFALKAALGIGLLFWLVRFVKFAWMSD